MITTVPKSISCLIFLEFSKLITNLGIFSDPDVSYLTVPSYVSLLLTFAVFKKFVLPSLIQPESLVSIDKPNTDSATSEDDAIVGIDDVSINDRVEYYYQNVNITKLIHCK